MVTVAAALGYAAQAKALADFAEKAWKWSEDFTKRSRSEAEQRDARLLAASGVLVAAMRSRASRAAICLLTAGWPIPASRATAEKLPLSTTRTNIRIASSWSIALPPGGGAGTIPMGNE
jgi:hypothetical protein